MDKETDAASPCKSYARHTHSVAPERVVCAHLLCGIHQHVLGAGNTVAVVGVHLVSVLYSMALLLAMGVYFLRLILPVEEIVDANLHLEHSAPPAECGVLRELILDLFFPAPDGRASTKKQWFLYWNLRSQFSKYLDGDLFARNKLIHHCGPFNNCGCKDRRDAVAGCANVIILAVLRRRPTAPSKNEWTKLWPALCFVVFGFCINAILIVVIICGTSDLTQCNMDTVLKEFFPEPGCTNHGESAFRMCSLSE